MMFFLSPFRAALVILFLGISSIYAIDIRASFIYWQAQADGLPIIRTEVEDAMETDLDSTLFNVGFQWDPGFKLGAGYCFPADPWNIQLVWTHLYTHGSREKSGLVGGGGGATLSHEKVVWKLIYNTADMTLDREICLSPCFSLTPLTGIRSAWLHQKMAVDLTDRDTGDAFTVTFNNPLWGIGGVFGLDLEWKFQCGWSIFSEVCVSQLFGRYHSRLIAPAALEGPVSFRENKAFSSLDSALGICWQPDFLCGTPLNLELAWENHTYINTIIVGDNLDLGDLNLHGCTFTAMMRF